MKSGTVVSGLSFSDFFEFLCFDDPTVETCILCCTTIGNSHQLTVSIDCHVEIWSVRSIDLFLVNFDIHLADGHGVTIISA